MADTRSIKVGDTLTIRTHFTGNLYTGKVVAVRATRKPVFTVRTEDGTLTEVSALRIHSVS